MRKVAVPLACFLLLTAEAVPQSSWQKVDLPSLGLNANSILNGVTASGNLVLSSVSVDPTYKALRSTDGGTIWETPPLTNLAPLKLKSLTPAFLYGTRSDSNYIMTNVNQGVTPWVILRPALNMTLADMHYINSSPGQAWAVGDTDYAARTSDNWTNFQILPFLVVDSVAMTSVQFFDSDFGFAAGRSRKFGSNASVIVRTTDGGATWQDRSLPDTCVSAPNLIVDFINPRTGWAVQTCGTITTFYKTVDSGATWSNQGFIDLFFQASAIDAVDSMHVWIAGRLGTNGRIVRTANGGAGWGYATIPPSGRLLSLAMKDTTTGFACGEAASLLVYSPIGTDVADDRHNRPRSFALSQNYPNPFNGETRILFTLQKSQPVALTIYNILGQPVRKLLDETRPAGKNEVSWDGRDERGLSVPSGIYLYKLGTSKEKQVRKMVLLK
ncbi:MAG: T9SS type A sorting domain-containing protein [candidate division Zixibacteria bacterium]|nr:T9SS type A sorting domain-containing protein [candidate division Zixibacteria bacterium]